MGESVRILPYYTYQDYCLWEGKWEIIDGIPYAMSPAPVPKHQYISANLTSAFVRKLQKCKKCKASQPVDYKIAEDTIVQPDFLIYCGNINKPFLDFAPMLVAEILSPSTALKDRHTKFQLYENAGVRYYLIISPDKEEIQIFEIVDGKYQLVAQGHEIRHLFIFEEGCKARVNFSEIW